MNGSAALCSLFVPGLGQASQGRTLAALVHFALACFVWIGTLGMLGWVVNLASAFGAAMWKPDAPTPAAPAQPDNDASRVRP